MSVHFTALHCIYPPLLLVSSSTCVQRNLGSLGQQPCDLGSLRSFLSHHHMGLELSPLCSSTVWDRLVPRQPWRQSCPCQTTLPSILAGMVSLGTTDPVGSNLFNGHAWDMTRYGFVPRRIDYWCGCTRCTVGHTYFQTMWSVTDVLGLCRYTTVRQTKIKVG